MGHFLLGNMKRLLTKKETLELATIGANTLRWFRESGSPATCDGIDYHAKWLEDVATFRNEHTSQPVTWRGLLMLVRMGWCAADTKACPETFQARFVDVLGFDCEPWQSVALEVSCEVRT